MPACRVSGSLLAFSLGHLLLINADVFVLLSDVLQGRQAAGAPRGTSARCATLTRRWCQLAACGAPDAAEPVSAAPRHTRLRQGLAPLLLHPSFKLLEWVWFDQAVLFLDVGRHLGAIKGREAGVPEEGAQQRQEHEVQEVSEVQRAGLDQHQGLCPCHPTLAAEGSGARGGEAAPLSRGQARFHGVGSRVRCARASVRRNGEAVPTSRERGP
ncbi:conserved hypothetical protein [Pseudomonas sp. 8O]|nr:conserved hypothetical protein [Pseudomonas sp. 8O]